MKKADPSATGKWRIERRRSSRYSIDIPVKIKIASSTGVSTYAYGRGNNVSMGGMSAYVAHELTVGATIQLQMTLPHSAWPIECEAVVRNRQSFLYGLEFKSMSAERREQLARTCKTLGVIQSV